MLENTAKISDIIAALQNMEGINQKADLKSALVAKGIDALDTDSMANLIGKLNSTNLVLNGKRWASGTSTSDSNGNVTVTGLTFSASIIIMHLVSGSAWDGMTIYWNKSTSAAYEIDTKYGLTASYVAPTISATGFILKSTPNNITNVEWIAIK